MTNNEIQTKNRTISYKGILYSLNQKEKTASVIGLDSLIDNIFIPYSIKDEASNEYVVTIISKNAFNFSKSIKTIEFATNSEICIIEKSAFFGSSIENIKIPPHLTIIDEFAFSLCFQLKNIDIPDNSELETIKQGAFSICSLENFTIPSKLVNLEVGWCDRSPRLTKISVSSKNPLYSFYEDKYVLKKSSIEKENFDILAFSIRNIEIAMIPSFIEIIGPFAFNGCSKLHEIEFQGESKLQKIEECAFSYSAIETFNVPSGLIEIGQNSFCSCEKLKSIKISKNSKLQTIQKSAFLSTSIESFLIPKSLINLNDGWCNNTLNLNNVSVVENHPRFSLYDDKYIIGKSTLDADDFDVLEFAARDIENVKIPSFIKTIGVCAFDNCKKIKNVDIQEDSNLQSIEDDCFYESSVVSFFVPPHVKQIGKSAFYLCKQLKKIEIPPNSELEKIGRFAFSETQITSLFFPKSLTVIENGAFKSCVKLCIIEIDDESNLKHIDKNIFLDSYQVLIMARIKLY